MSSAKICSQETLVIHGIPNDGTRHAVPATAASAELCGANFHDLYARGTQLLVGVLVAVISHHHAGLNGHDVVGIVPLLTRSSVGIAARLCLLYTSDAADDSTEV